MSGGVAFVLDEDGGFRKRVNPTMLDQLEELDDADAVEVHDLISEHVRRTGSELGRRVLDEFDGLRAKFVKVFPTDYKRVLAQWATEEADQRDGGAGHVSGAISSHGEGFAVGEEQLGG
jgi:glutamate synthase domain-containing protein 3